MTDKQKEKLFELFEDALEYDNCECRDSFKKDREYRRRIAKQFENILRFDEIKVKRMLRKNEKNSQAK